MKRVFAVALLVLGAAVYAQTSATKKELVARVLQLQQPGIEALARGLAEQPAAILMQRAGTLMQTRIPPDKREPIAKDIQATTGGKLTAVVATHRHRDHISGFATNVSGTASGDIIAKLKPNLVIQPWTEAPDLEETATAPHSAPQARHLSAAAHRVRTLWAMQQVASQVWAEAKRSRSLQPELRAKLGFLGENNVKNLGGFKDWVEAGGEIEKS